MPEIILGAFTCQGGKFDKKTGKYELTFKDERKQTLKVVVGEDVFDRYSVGDALDPDHIKKQGTMD